MPCIKVKLTRKEDYDYDLNFSFYTQIHTGRGFSRFTLQFVVHLTLNCFLSKLALKFFFTKFSIFFLAKLRVFEEQKCFEWLQNTFDVGSNQIWLVSTSILWLQYDGERGGGERQKKTKIRKIEKEKRRERDRQRMREGEKGGGERETETKLDRQIE